LLAIVVSVVAFVVSGLFLLTLVPEPAGASATDATVRASQPAGTPIPPIDLASSLEPVGLEQILVARLESSIARNARSEVRPSLQQGSEAIMASTNEHESAPPADAPLVNDPAASAWARSLPVETEGRRLQLEVLRLVAVQAHSHYTQLFDGEAIWFCPLPISEVESLLDARIFARVHRSHIVNLDRVAALRRGTDSDVVAMSAAIPYEAPVSRSRRMWLKQRLDGRPVPLRLG
jgi:DNA-binding LytR/AlgR family response regulator